MKQSREIHVRAVDLENLGVSIVYTNSEDPAELAEAQANAKLIAAAPDLLEALKGALAEVEASSLSEGVYFGPDNNIKSKIIAAIKKATE